MAAAREFEHPEGKGPVAATEDAEAVHAGVERVVAASTGPVAGAGLDMGPRQAEGMLEVGG